MQESEIEDLFLPKVYKTRFFEEFGIDLNKQMFRNSKKKWSQRITDCSDVQGKSFDEITKKNAKFLVANIAFKLGIKAVHSKDKPLIRNIVKNLEKEFALKP